MFKTEEGVLGFDWDNLDTGKRKYKDFIVYGSHKNLDDAIDFYSGIYNTIKTDKIYEGNVFEITDNFVVVNINAEADIYVHKTEFNANELNDLVGKDVSVKVLKKQKDLYIGSIKEVENQLVFEKIYKSAINVKDNTVFVGKVIKHIDKVGYIIQVDGVSTFMPGSFASLNYLTKDESEALVGKDIKVIAVSYSKENNNIIVSHKKYLQQLIPARLNEIKNNDKNEVYIGKVTGIKKFGIFVEFAELLTGMIHYTCYDDLTVDLMSQNLIVPGDLIKFKIKEISDKKIILTQK